MRHLAWKQILIAVAVSFVFGVAFGRFEFSHRMHDKWKDPEARQQWILKRLDTKLVLNTEQEEQIASILKASAPKMDAVRSKIRPELEALRQEVRLQIMPILTAEQQKWYDQMEADRQERKRFGTNR